VSTKSSLFNKRRSGVLLHPASLPGKHIGSMGKQAYDFIRKLSIAGISYWQMLPLNPTGPENSPYQSWSAFAGNPLLICPMMLCEWGILDRAKVELFTSEKSESTNIDYLLAAEVSDYILAEAYAGFVHNALLNEEFERFCIHNKYWLEEYSLFAALRKKHNLKPVQLWPAEIRNRNKKDLENERVFLRGMIDFHKFVQFVFYKQWFLLKQFANEHKVCLIGDLPIYVATDSVDVWANKHLFELDDELNPTYVAGVPPDYFSETGQLWGNPVYKWDEHIASGFDWWIQRVRCNLEMYDGIRIDHFRGFSEYWAVKAGSETAKEGAWCSAPGTELFQKLSNTFPELPVIAEDLGILTNEAVALRKQFGFPGMKILQFAFTNPSENEFLPHYYKRNCVVYTGTHDNNTIRGWFEEDALTEEKAFALEYLQKDESEFVDAMIRLAWSSVANTVVVPVQDFFGLDASARFNVPGTVEGNWLWKMTSEQMNSFPEDSIKKLNMLYARAGEMFVL
jgi:4-alpha-glucanotransferase